MEVETILTPSCKMTKLYRQIKLAVPILSPFISISLPQEGHSNLRRIYFRLSIPYYHGQPLRLYVTLHEVEDDGERRTLDPIPLTISGFLFPRWTRFSLGFLPRPLLLLPPSRPGFYFLIRRWLTSCHLSSLVLTKAKSSFFRRL